jgi:hypothetical protein
LLPVTGALLSVGVAGSYLHAQVSSGKQLVAIPEQSSGRSAAPSFHFVQSPMSFEPNIGQDSSAVRYVAYGRGYLLRLGASQASIEFSANPDRKIPAIAPKCSTLALNFVGGNATAVITATDKLRGEHSYFPAGDPKSWIPNVPTYGRVNYENLYHGIDLSFYGSAGRLEYDFTLRPGADAKTIQLALDGAEQAQLGKDGSLSLSARGSVLTLLKPLAYQPSLAGSGRRPVEVQYHLRPAGKATNNVDVLSFTLGEYDHSRPLIIDPVLVYGIDIPGAAGYSYPPYYFADTVISAMTVDLHGNVYIAARVASNNSNYSVFKFDPAGNLLLNVSLGSTDVQASPQAIAVDAAGDIYLAGSASQGLPTTAGAFQPTTSLSNYGQSGFLTVIRSDASALTYSTYLSGNSQGDAINGVAVDSSGKAYVTGYTSGSDFPTTSGVYQPSIPYAYSNQGFVAKLDPSQSGSSSLVYSTFLTAAGNSGDSSTGNGIAVDQSGNAYVIVNATSDYPVTKGAYSFEGISNGGAYATKLNANASALVYSAFLGPGTPAAIALDRSGEAYIVGSVTSAEFPTTPGAYQTRYAGGFATKLSADASSLLYSTFLSGPSAYRGSVTPTSVAILPGCVSVCDVYISGFTFTTDFPLINPIQSFPGKYVQSQPNSTFETGFLVNLASDGKTAVYSTYLGAATSTTYGSYAVPGVAADSSGNIYFASNVDGFDAPISLPAVQNPGEGFLLKISPANAGNAIAIPSQIVFNAVQAVHSTATNPGAVQVRNMGSAAVTLQRPFVFSSTEFSETDNCGSSLPAGGICTLNLSFTPAMSGQRAATLTISSNTPNSPTKVSLTGTAADGPNVTVSATSLTFADQVLKSSSAAQILTLTNSGDQPQPLPSISASLADYVTTGTCPAQLAAGASCQISIKFSPTQIGLRSGYLFIQVPGYYYYNGYSYLNGYDVNLTGTGVLSAAGTGTLTFSDTAINFGSLVIGAGTATQGVSLMNTGDTPVTINSITVATNAKQGGAADFSIIPPQPGFYACGYSPYPNLSYTVPFQLAPQTSCSIQVGFQPSISGLEAGTLEVADSASGSPHTVGLSGIGLHSVQPLTVNPATMAFPAQPVGDPSAAQTFYISNTGEDFVILDRAVTSGDFAVVDSNSTNCEGATLGPLSSCTLNIAFNPTAVGSRTGTLTLIDTLSSNPQVFNLTGTAIQATGALVLGQSSLVFPAQAKGTTSTSDEIVVSNPGNSPVTINNLATSGDFAVTSQFGPYNTACGGVLAPDSTCEIWIAFSPTQPSGQETGTLTIHSTVGNLPVSLSGTSFTSAQSIHLTPTTINFGSVKVGALGSSDGVNVFIENTGAEPVTFSNPPTITGISPTTSGDFSVSNVTCSNYVPFSPNQTLPPMPPGQSCSFSIAFSPSTQITEKATLTLVDSAGTQTIALSGLGVATVPPVTLQPATLAFDQQPVGSSTSLYDYSFEMFFYNNGSQPVTVNSVTVTAGSSDFSTSTVFGSCAGATVAAGSYCSTVFVFHPSAVGYRTGAVTFKDSTGKTYSAALAGYAVPEINSASLTPQALILPATSLQAPASPYNNPPAVVLNNIGNAPLTIGSVLGKNVSSTGDFSTVYPAGNDECSGMTIQPGSGCSVYVVFTPRATGTRTGSLTFPVTYADKTTASLTATLSGTGLPNVGSANLLPQTAVFADQVAGANSQNYQNEMGFVLTNAGTVQLTVGTLSGTNLSATPGSGSDFATAYDYCSKQTLPPGKSCTIDLYFLPVTAGKKTGSVTLPATYSGGATVMFTSTLSGNSVAPAPTLQVTPPGLAFNVEVVGTTDVNNVQTVVLTGTGNVPVKINSIVSSQNFTVASNNCNQSVPSQSYCSVTVAFTPLASTAPGPVTGTLTIVNNAPGSPHTVKLSGTAISVAQQLALSQTSVSFGNQTVSTASAPQVVYLTDLGSSSTNLYGPAPRVQINSIKLGGADAADFTETENCGGTLGFTIAGRRGCMITVAFAPGKSSLGTRTASVTITPAQGSPLVIQLVGIGVSPAPAATIFPASLTFGTQSIGSASSAQVFSVTNTGAVALSITQAIITHPFGFSTTSFSTTSDGCSHKSLAPGVNCLISVSFNPEVPGPLTGVLELKDNAGSSVQIAALSGTGAKRTQAILFRFREKLTADMPSIELLATATSGLPVDYAVVSGGAVLDGNMLSPTRPGMVVVRAMQPGNDKFAPAKLVDHTFVVRPEAGGTHPTSTR